MITDCIVNFCIAATIGSVVLFPMVVITAITEKIADNRKKAENRKKVLKYFGIGIDK